MRNTKIWTVVKAHGSHYSETDEMTKREAKARFAALAIDTTRNINNDYLDLLILKRCGNDEATMQRTGKGEYSYWIGAIWTDDGEYAAELLKAI